MKWGGVVERDEMGGSGGEEWNRSLLLEVYVNDCFRCAYSFEHQYQILSCAFDDHAQRVFAGKPSF